MHVIAILNQKGGVSKTTLSACLATAFSRDGLQTHLIDSDPQGTSSDWHAMAVQEGRDVVPISQLSRPVLHREIPRLSADVVIIDGAPRNNSLADSAIQAADLVIVPVQPSPLDIWATKELIDSVRDAVESRKDSDRLLKAAFIITRTQPNTVLGRTAPQAIQGYGFPVFENVICQRQDYPMTMAAGGTPLDLGKSNKAHQEILAVKDEIVRFLTN